MARRNAGRDVAITRGTKNVFADLDAFNPVRFDDQTLIVIRVK